MNIDNSILEDVRESVGLGRDTKDFDLELMMHINVALAKLNQNGVGNLIIVEDKTATWHDFKDPLALEGNKMFHMIPAYVKLSVKIIFDPPPPSAVEYYSTSINDILWRLKLAYEIPTA